MSAKLKSIRLWNENDTVVRIPDWVVDLESFCRWTDDDGFPEKGQISFLNGEVWIDMSKEQIDTHAQVKTEFAYVLVGLIRARRSDQYYCDGPFLENEDANVSNQPDGLFVSAESVRQGRVRRVEGRTAGHVAFEGSPDMALEVVSDSSVEKDTEILREAYFKAGIREYWLVDVRGEVKFDIYRLGRNGYVAMRKRGGWLRSEVFNHSFRLVRTMGEDGFAIFTLEVRAANSA